MIRTGAGVTMKEEEIIKVRVTTILINNMDITDTRMTRVPK